MIIKYYATSNNAEVMYELNDLQKIQAKGDNLESFHNTWIMVTSALSVMPSDDILETLYYQQIKGMKVLADDIAYYNRQERGEINIVTGKCEKTYQFLFRAVEKHLQQARQDKMRESLTRGLLGKALEPLRAPGAAGTPRGRPKAKAKSRDSSRAPSQERTASNKKDRPCHF